MKIVHMAMWLTEAVMYMYGVVSLIWEKNSLCVLDQMSLEPLIAEFWDEMGRGLEELDPQSVNLRQLGVVVQNLRQWKESRPWLVACHAESVL